MSTGSQRQQSSADMPELRRMRLIFSREHNKLMSTHATDEHFQAAPRDLCFKTSLCFKRYSPTHVLKLFLEHRDETPWVCPYVKNISQTDTEQRWIIAISSFSPILIFCRMFLGGTNRLQPPSKPELLLIIQRYLTELPCSDMQGKHRQVFSIHRTNQPFLRKALLCLTLFCGLDDNPSPVVFLWHC